jgi:hypothetical protein
VLILEIRLERAVYNRLLIPGPFAGRSVSYRSFSQNQDRPVDRRR